MQLPANIDTARKSVILMIVANRPPVGTVPPYRRHNPRMRSQHTVVALILSLLAFPAAAAITGSVMNADGLPVAGARVSLMAQETPEASRARLLSPAPDPVPLGTAQT